MTLLCCSLLPFDLCGFPPHTPHSSFPQGPNLDSTVCTINYYLANASSSLNSHSSWRHIALKWPSTRASTKPKAVATATAMAITTVPAPSPLRPRRVFRPALVSRVRPLRLLRHCVRRRPVRPCAPEKALRFRFRFRMGVVRCRRRRRLAMFALWCGCATFCPEVGEQVLIGYG